jgi:hypothetical protein
MVLRGQVQMALGMPSVKMSGGSGMGWAWLRATRRAVQAAMAAMAASRMSSTAAEDDPGLGEQAASADRPGPGALALGERAAGEGGEADLRVDLHHSDSGGADPGVDLEQLVPEGESLRGHAGGQADGHVDRHDLDGSVGMGGGDELVDVGRGVGGGGSAGEGDADPAGLAGSDS